MRISDWSSDVCSSDLARGWRGDEKHGERRGAGGGHDGGGDGAGGNRRGRRRGLPVDRRRLVRLERRSGRGRFPCRVPFRLKAAERKSVVWGKSVSVAVDLVCRRILKKKKQKNQ